MKKLGLRHGPWLRQATFLKWISQLEKASPSNKYTRKVFSQYSNSNKIRVDLLVCTVNYAFLDKPTRTSTSMYKNQGTKLLQILHMKCAVIDSHTK